MRALLQLRLMHCASALALLCAVPLPAQQPAKPGAAVADSDTIHVSAHIIQIPVLALDGKRRSLPPIAPDRFRVHFDFGPTITPISVRQEGDDPITLAVLLDLSQGKNVLRDGLRTALASLAPTYLHSADRVAIFVTDGCDLWRTAELETATEEHIRNGVAAAMEHKRKGGCARLLGVWGAVDRVARQMASEPGRRVLLAVTDGDDETPNASYDVASERNARETATNAGVAVFSLAERGQVVPAPPSDPVMLGGPTYGQRSRGPQMQAATADQRDRGSPPLVILSEGSGGMVLEADAKTLEESLHHFTELVRGRYILEFTPPTFKSVEPVQHFDVNFGMRGSFVRAAGTSITRAEPAQLDGVEHGPSTPETTQTPVK